ncbi:PCF11 [Sanghuangporus weigelae]
MSMYQHAAPQSLGHSYPPPPPHNYVQHAQYAMPAYSYSHPPFSVQPLDPSSFRRDFAARLSELSVNSRPIIQNLSMMAQSYNRYSDIVADCLQAHIRRVPAWMKLPAFYVLDAISKNVYDPYAAKFSVFVVPLFLEAYGQVDPQTRSKMEEMLVTWRTGAPSGKELFGVAAQVSLERQIWGNDSSVVAESSSRRPAQVSITKSQVLAELDVTLALKEQALLVNPYDALATNQANVLRQLRRMVEHGVSQEELQQILSQLRAMGRETAAVPPPPPPIPVAPSPPVPVVYNAPPTVPALSQHAHATNSSSVPIGLYPGNVSVNQPPSSSAAPIPTAPANISGISSLFDSLVKAGLVSANSTPVGAGMNTHTPPPAPDTPDEVKAKAEQKARDDRLEVQRSYARKILGMNIRLTTTDITRQRPQNISLLYDYLPIQCKQCGFRFHDDSAGKKQYQDHLDMHFRQNRRAKEVAGRGHSRSWFISINDWVSEPLTDVKGKGREVLTTGRTNTDFNPHGSGKRDAELRSSVVVVPPGDEAKNISCPVCKETLKSEFREEDEEWVWQNAVKVKDKIYHATCHAEMATSATLASKLRADESGMGATRSRSGTPERTTPSTPIRSLEQSKVQSPRPLSPERTLVADALTVVGVKRKAEGDSQGIGSLEALTGTPPPKKVVLSAA